MKKNFLVTTGLIDTWELSEKNFILGRWCEFYQFNDSDKDKFKNKIPKKENIIKNTHHWEDHKKKNKDYQYLEKKMEYLLEIIAEKLSLIHDVNENKEYWRLIVFCWLSEYTATIFDRWEYIRIFFEKHNAERFYSNFILLNDFNYIPKNHLNFKPFSQQDEWNHLVFLRIFDFLKIKNLSLIEKKNIINDLKKKSPPEKPNISLFILAIQSIDKIISKFAFKFNKIIFESFYFPKKEYLKICFKFRLIPSRYLNFFDFEIKNNFSSKEKNDKRAQLKSLMVNIDSKEAFIQFLLQNIYKDMPKSYLEDFDTIKKKIFPLAKQKKIIFSMHSLEMNDNFRIYLAESKKVGTKYIHTEHGGGFGKILGQFFNFFEKVSDKIIRWDNTSIENQLFPSLSVPKKDIYNNLSPTLPTIKLDNPKMGSNCSIVFYEVPKYILKISLAISFNQSIDFFYELTQFVKNLNPEIKTKIKFRVKKSISYNSQKKFSKMFSEKNIDKVSFKNSFKKTILNSKLIIITSPSTTFSEAMHSNIPTILIIKKDHYEFSESASHTFNELKNNKIAFENFDEAKNHINKYWNDLDSWWKDEKVQAARKKYLKNFFNIKPDWCREWSDYIYSLSSPQ